MNEPKTPWPDKEEATRLFRQAEKTGHTQMLLKCRNCGLEFLIMTWRTGAELAAAFGVYGDIEVSDKQTVVVDGKEVPIPKELGPARVAPEASQITCPECGKRGDVMLNNYRRAKGGIYAATKHMK